MRPMFLAATLFATTAGLPAAAQADGSSALTVLTGGEASDLSFGRSVDVAGDRVLVGAPGAARLGENTGAAFLFEFDGAAWTRTRLDAPDGAPGDRFGWRVAILDERLVIAAPWARDADGGREGALYVFERGAQGWDSRRLTTDQTAGEAQLGRSLASDGARIYAGAPFDDNDGGEQAGAVFVFNETSAGWRGEKLLSGSAAPGGWFGLNVAVDRKAPGAGPADAVLASGYATDRGGREEVGAASLFLETDGGWRETDLTAGVTLEARDHFGRGLAVDEAVLFVGAEEDDNANGADAGGVHVFNAEALPARRTLVTRPGGGPRQYFGFLVAADAGWMASGASDRVNVFRHGPDGVDPAGALRKRTGRRLSAAISGLALAEGRLVVGAPRAGPSGAGEVWIHALEP